MTLLSFGFSPVFLSVMIFVILMFSKLKNKGRKIQILFLVILSFSISFAYPLSKIYVTNSYEMFDDFFYLCFFSALIASAINMIILLINGVRNERTKC